MLHVTLTSVIQPSNSLAPSFLRSTIGNVLTVFISMAVSETIDILEYRSGIGIESCQFYPGPKPLLNSFDLAIAKANEDDICKQYSLEQFGADDMGRKAH